MIALYGALIIIMAKSVMMGRKAMGNLLVIGDVVTKLKSGAAGN